MVSAKVKRNSKAGLPTARNSIDVARQRTKGIPLAHKTIISGMALAHF